MLMLIAALLSQAAMEAGGAATGRAAAPEGAVPYRELPQRARAEVPLPELFRPDDYPLRPLRRGIEGATSFRLEIDSRGAITDCSIVRSSGDSDLDRAACAIVRERARFQPALDALGRPIPDTVPARVFWRLQGEPSWSFAPETLVTTISWSDPDPVCSETVNGEDAGRLPARECAAHFGPAVEAVREGRGKVRVALVESLSPDGRAAPEPDASEFGERVWMEEVELEVAPDGKVMACVVLSSDTPPSMPFEGVPHLCDTYFGRGGWFEPAAEDESATRRIRVRYAVYLRTDRR